MHYLPLMMHSDTAADSIKSPFYYYFDGRNLAVCFCVDKDFALSQLEITRAQHFTEEYVKSDGAWGLGYFEFGSIEQVMLFVEKWDVKVQTKIGEKSPSALSLWSDSAIEPHRLITFDQIREEIKLAQERAKSNETF